MMLANLVPRIETGPWERCCMLAWLGFFRRVLERSRYFLTEHSWVVHQIFGNGLLAFLAVIRKWRDKLSTLLHSTSVTHTVRF